MSRIGILCLPATGHLNPAIALARRLVANGHAVTFFEPATCRPVLKAAGLPLSVLSEDESWDAPANSEARFLNTIEIIRAYSRMALDCGPAALQEQGIRALLVDSTAAAGSTLAEYLGIPFVTLSFSPLFYPDDEIPPPICSWLPRVGNIARERNRRANLVFARLVKPILDDVNRTRQDWGLPGINDVTATFSKAAIIVQMPRDFDFEQWRHPPQVLYAGPFQDLGARRPVKFPWERLDGRPIIYACLGTVRNSNSLPYRIITEACSQHDVQLVISLGGGATLPQDIAPLPSNVIAVHFAPQVDLIARSAAVICHAGLNTTLEALSAGKPIVAIPIADDQPGVAARIVRVGAGVKISYRALSVEALAKAVRTVLNGPQYRAAAKRMSVNLQSQSGVEAATCWIERILRL